VKAFALKFVRFARIEDHLLQGWMAMIPNGAAHHHHYGIEMKWICRCPVPGGFAVDRRVPATQTENTNGRTATGS